MCAREHVLTDSEGQIRVWALRLPNLELERELGEEGRQDYSLTRTPGTLGDPG